MKRKLLSVMLVSTVAIGLVGCGDDVKENESNVGSNIEVSAEQGDSSSNIDSSENQVVGDAKKEFESKNEEKESIKEENKTEVNKEENKKPAKEEHNKAEVNKEESKADKNEDKFSKYSDQQIIKLTNDSINFYKELDKTNGEVEEVGGDSYFLMQSPYETVAKRKAAIGKYFVDGTINEQYKTIGGKNYVKSILNSEFNKELDYKKVMERKVNGDTLTVKFVTEVKSGAGIDDEEKVLRFKIVNNELRLASKSFDTSWYDANN